MKIPFFLVTGFLGSGKTTFLKRILDNFALSKKIAIIQNEFAPANVDGKELKNLGKPFQILEINNGSVFCVCLLNDFVQSLEAFLEETKPEAIFLENVKNLVSHNGGATFRIMLGALEEIDYSVSYQVIDARNWVPQHRERVFFVGFDRKQFGDVEFTFPDSPGDEPKLGSILQQRVEKKYWLSEHLWRYLQDYAAKHKAKGNGFGYGLCDTSSVARTLSARYYKDGSEILIARDARHAKACEAGQSIPRRLTPRECSRLMGFDRPGQSDFKIPVSDTRAYKQFGNSVVVPVFDSVARIMRARIIKAVEMDSGTMPVLKLQPDSEQLPLQLTA